MCVLLPLKLSVDQSSRPCDEDESLIYQKKYQKIDEDESLLTCEFLLTELTLEPLCRPDDLVHPSV